MDRCFFRFVTMQACDRQTDGQTDGQNSHYVNLAKLSFVWYKNLDLCFFSFCHNTRV